MQSCQWNLDIISLYQLESATSSGRSNVRLNYCAKPKSSHLYSKLRINLFIFQASDKYVLSIKNSINVKIIHCQKNTVTFLFGLSRNLFQYIDKQVKQLQKKFCFENIWNITELLATFCELHGVIIHDRALYNMYQQTLTEHCMCQQTLTGHYITCVSTDINNLKVQMYTCSYKTYK